MPKQGNDLRLAHLMRERCLETFLGEWPSEVDPKGDKCAHLRRNRFTDFKGTSDLRGLKPLAEPFNS
jgi:hypothetical protein